MESLADPRVFKRGYDHIRKNDPILGKILREHGLLDFKAEGDLFEALVESILSQQLAGPAAEAIIRKVRAIYPGGRLLPESVCRTPTRKLRSAGVSPQKLTYLKDLSKRVSRGSIDLESLRAMEDEEVIRVLDEVRGIGPWTVQMFLIFTLGRPNVFPLDDLGVKKGIQQVYSLRDLPKKAEMESLAETWRPYRTVASLYLWRHKDRDQRKG
jgi:DNA-3-methyladenine glycosylase II